MYHKMSRTLVEERNFIFGRGRQKLNKNQSFNLTFILSIYSFVAVQLRSSTTILHIIIIIETNIPNSQRKILTENDAQIGKLLNKYEFILPTRRGLGLGKTRFSNSTPFTNNYIVHEHVFSRNKIEHYFNLFSTWFNAVYFVPRYL